MKGIADRRIEEAILVRLAEGPVPVVELLAAARDAAGPALGRREGALHALLHRLVREGRVEVVGRAPDGGAAYGLAGAAPAGGPESQVVPPPASARDARAALSVAAGVRDPEDRGRVVGDVIAHRAALAARGATRAFGGLKPARILLARVDRGRTTLCVPENGWEHLVRFVRHEVPSVLLTAAVLAAAYLFVAEFRVVPSNSMQPTLKPGDRLLVRKWGGRQVPARFKTVVFRRGDGVVLVKRAVGLPGERIAIDDGDLVVDGRIAVKPDDVREDLREPLVRSVFDAEGHADGWEPVGGAYRRPLRYARPLYADEPAYANADGTREINLPPRPLAHDVYVTARVEGAAELRIAFPDEAPEAHDLTWTRAADGAEEAGEIRGVVAVSRATARGSPGPVTVTLSVVDGQARVTSAVLHPAWSWSARPSGHAEVWMDTPTPGSVRSVAIDRDVHYTNDGQFAVDPAAPYVVPEGHVFFLGDHSAHSRDCRFREVGPIPLDHLIGPVIFRVWPPARFGPVR